LTVLSRVSSPSNAPFLSYRTLTFICDSDRWAPPLIVAHAEIDEQTITNGLLFEIRLLNSETREQLMAVKVERREEAITSDTCSSELFIHRSLIEGFDG
ncbi:hypothetical protein PFISCL1PPCAC_20890, partial [Pristionchus fissidentatus]